MSTWIGKTLGKVYIDSLLARGGMAVVYLGMHTTLQRKVVVKILRNDFEDDVSSLERFQREAQVVAKLRHQNIVQVFDFDTAMRGRHDVVRDLGWRADAVEHATEGVPVLAHTTVVLGEVCDGVRYLGQASEHVAAILKKIAPDLQSDGEMHADSALSEILRQRVFPHSALKGEANLLVFPTLDSANIALTTVKQMMDALHVGPILLGTDKPAHILTPSVTSRGIVNMTALAVVEASQNAIATLKAG